MREDRELENTWGERKSGCDRGSERLGRTEERGHHGAASNLALRRPPSESPTLSSLRTQLPYGPYQH